uniref:Uncharacterized protein n=1 Tax=Solanum lycopersicum TaxID=4081 RepID=A0A3Q7GGN3_SOLLC
MIFKYIEVRISNLSQCKILVSEFMSRGSLENHLFRNQKITMQS